MAHTKSGGRGGAADSEGYRSRVWGFSPRVGGFYPERSAGLTAPDRCDRRAWGYLRPGAIGHLGQSLKSTSRDRGLLDRLPVARLAHVRYITPDLCFGLQHRAVQVRCCGMRYASERSSWCHRRSPGRRAPRDHILLGQPRRLRHLLPTQYGRGDRRGAAAVRRRRCYRYGRGSHHRRGGPHRKGCA